MRAILFKDILVEFRSRQVISSMVVLGLLVGWIFRVCIEGNAVSGEVIGAAAFLAGILFAAVLSSERVFSAEREEGCINGLLLGPVNGGDIFAAKFVVNFVMLCVFEIFAFLGVMFFFDVGVAGRWAGFFVVVLLINIGVAAVGTLIGCLVQGARSRSSLLSLLLLAVLGPVVVPAVFSLLWVFGGISGEVGGVGVLAMVGNWRRAIGFLAAFDVIFVIVCRLLFGFVLREQ